MTEPFTIDRTPSDDPLDYLSLDDLECTVKAHLPPAVHRIALKWGALQADTILEDFINVLEPHLGDRVPDFRTLVAHVLVDANDGGPCAGARGQEDDDAA